METMAKILRFVVIVAVIVVVKLAIRAAFH
jgi:hypothetical protein